jgi:hypothetical protein
MTWVTPPVLVGLGVSVAAMAASTFTAAPSALWASRMLWYTSGALAAAPIAPGEGTWNHQ